MVMFKARARGTALLAGALLVLISLLSMGGQAGAASGSVKGRFESQAVTGAGCTSPVGLCTAGTLTGGIKGTFEFTATSLIQSVDTPTTGVVLYTGDIAIHTKDGDLSCKDAGAFRTTGAGEVSSVCTIIGGTDGLAGTSGVIQFVGTFTTAFGGAGDYRGTLFTT